MRRCWQVDSQDVDTLKTFNNYRNQKQEVASLLCSHSLQWESEANGPSVEDVPCKTGAEKTIWKSGVKVRLNRCAKCEFIQMSHRNNSAFHCGSREGGEVVSIQGKKQNPFKTLS